MRPTAQLRKRKSADQQIIDSSAANELGDAYPEQQASRLADARLRATQGLDELLVEIWKNLVFSRFRLPSNERGLHGSSLTRTNRSTRFYPFALDAIIIRSHKVESLHLSMLPVDELRHLVETVQGGLDALAKATESHFEQNRRRAQ